MKGKQLLLITLMLLLLMGTGCSAFSEKDNAHEQEANLIVVDKKDPLARPAKDTESVAPNPITPPAEDQLETEKPSVTVVTPTYPQTGETWETDSGKDTPIPPKKEEEATVGKVTPDKKKSDSSAVLTRVVLTEREQLIGNMNGEYFLLFEDPAGLCAMGIKLYRGEELKQNLGTYQGKFADKQPTQLMISGRQEEGVNVNWEMTQASTEGSFREALSDTFLTENRSLIKKAAVNANNINVKSGEESVLAYIAFQYDSGSGWDTRYDIPLTQDTTLSGIEKQLKNYAYCYVITGSIKEQL